MTYKTLKMSYFSKISESYKNVWTEYQYCLKQCEESSLAWTSGEGTPSLEVIC